MIPHPHPTRLAALLAACLTLATSTAAFATGGPVETPREPLPELEPRPYCERWTGTYQGNDTTAFELVLCTQPGGISVVGTARTSSPRSGISVMLVEGLREDGGGFTLRDSIFIVDEPNFPWAFCMAESYQLAQTSDGGLVGSVTARECHDYARVSLVYDGESEPPSLD